jgi:hypothetical protein
LRTGGRHVERQAPQFLRNISTGETGWFASPSLADLNGDGKLEIVAPFYSTFVFDVKGYLLGKGTASKGRVYAPGVVADLDGDKIPDIVVGGNEGTVAAYEIHQHRVHTLTSSPRAAVEFQPLGRLARRSASLARARRAFSSSGTAPTLNHPPVLRRERPYPR